MSHVYATFQAMRGRSAPRARSELFISVAAVDAPGHELLFAYPEYRCDSLDITARN